MMKIRKKFEKQAFAQIRLNLFDKILRKILKETIFENVFSKLDSLYLQKSLSKKVQLKHHSYSFKMDSSKDIEQNLDNFKGIISNFDGIDHKIENET